MSGRDVPDNQRAYTRYPIELGATLSIDGWPDVDCSVRDFCIGGMFVNCAACAGDKQCDFQPATIPRGRDLVVAFSVPTEGGRIFTLQGKVARAATNGLGIQFTRENPNAIKALERFADKQAGQSSENLQGEIDARRNEPPPSGSDALLQQAESVLFELLPGFLKGYFERLNNQLFEHADEASSNSEQNAYFEAMNEFKRQRQHFIDHFSQLLKNQFGVFAAERHWEPIGNPGDHSKGQLSLVDKGEFNDWLTVMDITSRLEAVFKRPLNALQQRLDSLSKHPINKNNNPFGPVVIGHVWATTLRELELDLEYAPRQLAFSVFEDMLDTKFGELYQDLNERLSGAGILPGIEDEEKIELIRSKEKAKREEAAEGEEGAEADDSEQSGDTTPSASSGASNNQTTRHSPGVAGGQQPTSGGGGPHAAGGPAGATVAGHQGGGGDQPAAPQGAEVSGAGTAVGGSPIGASGVEGRAGSDIRGAHSGGGLGAVQSLLSLRRNLQAGQGGQGAVSDGHAPAANGSSNSAQGSGSAGASGPGFHSGGAGIPAAGGGGSSAGGESPAVMGGAGVGHSSHQGSTVQPSDQTAGEGGATGQSGYNGAPGSTGAGAESGAAAHGAAGSREGGGAGGAGENVTGGATGQSGFNGAPGSAGAGAESGAAAHGAAGSREDGGAAGAAENVTSDTTGQNGGGSFSLHELMQGLNQLQSRGETKQLLATERAKDFTETLQKSLAQETPEGEQRTIPEAQQGSLDLMGGLLHAIYGDPLMDANSKGWMELLTIPLLKAMLLDEEVISNNNHPAQKLLNRVEQLGMLLPEEGESELKRKLQALLQRINEEVERNPNVFAEVLGDVESLHKNELEQFVKNIDRVIGECEEQERLDEARRVVVRDLDRVIGGKTIAELALEILDKGLKNVMLRTYMREGANGHAYKRLLELVQMLVKRLGGDLEGASKARDKGMVDFIGQALRRTRAGAEVADPLVKRLQDALNRTAQGDVLAQKHIPHLPGYTENHDGDKRQKGESQFPKELEPWLDKVARLREGDLISLIVNGKVVQRKLVWLSQDRHELVFVDRRGQMTERLDDILLAEYLQDGIADLLDGWNIPLTERATYAMLQEIHGDLASQAQVDALTGLSNRRTFENYLHDLVNGSSGDYTHQAFYLDVDRFGVVNSVCGHAAGDQLLIGLSQILQQELGEGGYLARLGGDEFGIVLENYQREQAEEWLEDLQSVIHGYHFIHEGEEFPVTASIGWSEVNKYSGSVGNIMSAIDSASALAKEMGRDQVQRHQPDNIEINRRTAIIGWVGRINHLFDDDRVQLRCQRIAPSKITTSAAPHYEVLLSVMNDDGKPVPLDEFIMAAELYNRMGDIDAWVVSTVFTWLLDNRELLDNFGGFSVNLSGVTLSKRSLMKQIAELVAASPGVADKICFEVTETVAVQNMDRLVGFMREVQEHGCQFSLDDFGTGFSSYSYLTQLPVDFLKIDGTFVKNILQSPSDYAVVKSINEIGHVLGKTTIAEYAENREIIDCLSEIGVDLVQGYGVEKTHMLDELPNILSTPA